MSTQFPRSVVSFNGLKLREKILFLPAIVALFMVTIAVLSYIQLGHIEARVANVTDVQSPLANQASQLLQNTLQKDNVVARYLRTGDVVLIQKFQDLSETGVLITERIRQLNEGGQHQQLQARINTEKENFNAIFNERVVVATKQRDAMLSHLMSDTAPSIEKAVTDIVALSNIEGEVKPASVANEVLNSFLVARIYLGNYIQNNSEQDVERFELEIMGAESAIADLSTLIDDARRIDLLAKTASTLDQYSTSFEAIVVSTNERNQAVAGELAESRLQLINAANDLQTAVWTQFESSGLQINDAISETNTVSVV